MPEARANCAGWSSDKMSGRSSARILVAPAITCGSALNVHLDQANRASQTLELVECGDADLAGVISRQRRRALAQEVRATGVEGFLRERDRRRGRPLTQCTP